MLKGLAFICCCAGIIDYLTTEISTSKQKKFSLVTFIDTPGLVDGDMKYPFDVNRAILWLGKSRQMYGTVVMLHAGSRSSFSFC